MVLEKETKIHFSEKNMDVFSRTHTCAKQPLCQPQMNFHEGDDWWPNIDIFTKLADTIVEGPNLNFETPIIDFSNILGSNYEIYTQ